MHHQLEALDHGEGVQDPSSGLFSVDFEPKANDCKDAWGFAGVEFGVAADNRVWGRANVVVAQYDLVRSARRSTLHPGNPGLATYYIDFLHAIYTSKHLTGAGIEIVAVSHRGHAPLPKVGTNAVWGDNGTNASQAARGWGTSLSDQVRHKIGVLDAIQRQYAREETKVVVVGHSIGAWMAGEILKARPDAVDGLHLLFPTMAWIGRTPNARRIKLLANRAVTAAVLPLPLLVLSLLPLWALVWVIRLLTRQPSAAALATAELLTTPGAVYNALTMAGQEFATVQALEKPTVDALHALTAERGGRIRSYWAADETDAWAPGWIRSQVESTLSLQRVHLAPSLGLGGAKKSEPSRRGSHVRTRSFSVSEYRSSPGSIPDLRHAKAIRRPNGEIVIEAQVVEPSSESESDEPTRGNSERGAQYHYGRARATATHCRLGMPHAFCLNHSEDMASIVAHWIAHDHLSNII